MKRSTITLIIVIAAIVLAGVGVYFLYIRASSGGGGLSGILGGNGSLPVVGTQTGGGGASGGGVGGSGNTGGFPGNLGGNVPIIGFPSANGGAPSRFGLVSNDPVISYFVNSAYGTTVVEPDGKIASILNGQPTFLSSTAIQNIISANFSFDGTRLLVSFGDPAKPQASIFTIATKSWSALPAGILSPVWSPADLRFAYLTGNSDGSEALSTLDVSKSSAKSVTLATLHMQDSALSWPSQNELVLADRPSSYETGAVSLFDIAQKAFSQPLAGGAGLETIWSNSTSSQALVFTAGAAERGGSLALWNSSGPQNLTFLTLPSKCVFNTELVSSTPAVATTTATATSSASTGKRSSSAARIPPPPAPVARVAFYCGIPQDPSTLDGQALPDVYDQKALFTVDSLFKVRADSGEMSEVLAPPIPVDATNLRVFNNALYFVNRYDQKLYAVSLGA